LIIAGCSRFARNIRDSRGADKPARRHRSGGNNNQRRR